MKNELYWMKLALEIAKNSGSDCPIGSVIVHNGQEVIATAHNEVEAQKNPVAHSEMLSIQRACAKLGTRYLENCVLYCTLEPCPMCFAAIKLARVDRVVFGSFRGPEKPYHTDFIGGIMAQECSEILQNFFKNLRND